MYKLIIIDDEITSANQFGSAVEWGNYGFHLEGVFSDSEEAMRYLETNSIDLVFTDIRMPKHTGMDVAEFCLTLKKPPYVVFISAFSEFEYARQAIKYKIFDYITKPFSYSDIENILIKIYTALEESSDSEMFTNHLELLEQQYVFSEIMLGNLNTQEELKKKLATINLPSFLSDAPCAKISVTINDFQNYISATWKYGTDKLHNAISYLAQSKSRVFCCNFAYAEDTFEIIAIDINKSFATVLGEYINQLKSNLKQLLSIEDVTINVTQIDSLSNFALNASQRFNPTMEDPIIEKSIAFIRDNYQNDISLNDVAKHIALSRVYFCSYFKKNTGESFVDTLNKYRVEKAAELLVSTSSPVSVIAEQVGYKSIPYFYKTFAKLTELTPNEYRNRKGNDI